MEGIPLETGNIVSNKTNSIKHIGITICIIVLVSLTGFILFLPNRIVDCSTLHSENQCNTAWACNVVRGEVNNFHCNGVPGKTFSSSCGGGIVKNAFIKCETSKRLLYSQNIKGWISNKIEYGF